MALSPSSRRHLAWAATGFVAGYVVVYALFLSDALHTSPPHFEALYGGSRPQGVLAWLRFQHVDEVVFLLAGVVSATLVSLARVVYRRRGSAARAT